MNINLNFKNSLMISTLVSSALFVAYWGYRLVQWILCPTDTAQKADSTSRAIFNQQSENQDSGPFSDRILVQKSAIDDGLVVRLCAPRHLIDSPPKEVTSASELERKEANATVLTLSSRQEETTPPASPQREKPIVATPVSNPQNDARIQQIYTLFPDLFKEFQDNLPQSLLREEQYIPTAFEKAKKAAEEAEIKRSGEPNGERFAAPILAKNYKRGTNFIIQDGLKSFLFCVNISQSLDPQLHVCTKGIYDCIGNEPDWEYLMHCLCTDALGFNLAFIVQGSTFKDRCANTLKIENLELRRRNHQVFPQVHFSIQRAEKDGRIEKIKFIVPDITFDLVQIDKDQTTVLWEKAITGYLEGEVYFEGNKPILKIDRKKAYLKSELPTVSYHCKGVSKDELAYDFCDTKS